MGSDRTKKELQAQYKEREVVGGVFAIRNTLSGKMLISTTTDIQGSRNRFEFAQKTGSCVDPRLQSDWDRDGNGQFVFEPLEEIKRETTQTEAEFRRDIDILKDILMESMSCKDLY